MTFKHVRSDKVFHMELSPLAKEKLAKISELTTEEKVTLKYSGQLTSLLAEYYTNELNHDDLWKELKKHKEEGRGFLLKDAQLKMLDAMKISSSDMDIDKLRRGLLAAETLKDNGDNAGLEHDLKSIEDLRQQYKEERDKAYEEIKSDIEQQVRLVAQQLAGQAARKGAVVDIQSSIEANAKASPEWKSFSSRHDSICGQRFQEHIARLREKL